VKREILFLKVMGIVFLFTLSTAVGFGICDTGKIKVGISLALTGPYGEMGRTFAQGWEIGFKRINDEGGINGKKIEWKIMDDAFAPYKTVENTRYLIEEWGADILAGYYGALPVKAAVDYLEKRHKKIPFFFPMDGTRFIKQTIVGMLYSIDSFYEDEIRVVFDYFLMTKGAYRWAVVYKNDVFSQAINGMLVDYLLRIGVSPALINVDDLEATKQLINSRWDVVILNLSAKDGISFIKTMVNEMGEKDLPNIVAISSVFPYAYIRKVAKMVPEGSFFFTQVVPHFENTDYRIVREYLRDIKKYDSGEPGFVSLHGYIAARLLGEILRRANGEVSVDVIRQASECAPFEIGIEKPLRFSPVIHRCPIGVGLMTVREGGSNVEMILWEDFTHRISDSGNLSEEKNRDLKDGGENKRKGRNKKSLPIEVRIQKVSAVR